MDRPQIDLSGIASSIMGGGETPAAYDQGEGPVRYLDGGALERPFDPPRQWLVIGIGIAAIAAVIGIVLAVNVLGATTHAAQRAAASMEENLAREVSVDLPALSSFAGMDAATLRQSVDALGHTTYLLSTEEDIAAGALDVIKLPSDVSVEEAAVLYAQGIGNLDASDAALLLNGSWRLQYESADGFNLSLRYADFDSGSLDAAIEAAIQAEGFDSAAATELAVDEVGNTYRSGTVDAGGAVYDWRVSAIALSEVYDIAGMPDTAIYVGIRLTPAA